MRKIILLFVLLLMCCNTAFAVLVEDIIVLNNNRFTDATVRAYLDFEKGDDLNPDLVNSSIKSLYNTGFFRNIIITQDGGSVYVDVVENSFVRNTKILGSKRVQKSDLEEVLIHRPRSIFSEYKLKREIDLMKQVYQRKGYLAVKIDAKFVENEQNVDIEYHIVEGGAQKVQKIEFMGNSEFRDGRLKRVISTRQKAFWRILSSSDRYDPDRVEYDSELLRSFYRNKGYIDFELLETDVEENEKGDFIITFNVIEGKKYEMGEIKIESELDHPLPDLHKFLTMRNGDTYNDKAVEKDVEILTDKLGEFGFAFVNIVPKIFRAQEGDVVDLIYTIKKSPKIYVNQIKIENNTRTMDSVIRREMIIDEGDPYNSSKIKRSVQRIKSLGYFHNVEHQNKSTDEHDRVDVMIDVDESSTGELNFGASFSTAEQGFGGFIKLGERNLLGKGLDTNLKFSKSAKNTNVSASIADPYFMGYKFRAGLKLFADEQDQAEQSAYKYRSIGGIFSGTYSITERLAHVVRYSLKEDTLRDIPQNASQYIKSQEGSSLHSAIGHTLILSDLDDGFDPTKGYVFSITQDYAGVGGDVKFFKNIAKAVGYIPLVEDRLFLKAQLQGGVVNGHSGTKLRINDRFFLGPDDIRGFDVSGLGPRDSDTKEALGGTKFVTFKTDFIFPIALGEDAGLKGYVFHDIGNLWGGINAADIIESNKYRASYGYGFSMDTPLGPLTIDWGYAYSKESFDKTKKFRLSYRTPF